ncbi:hypothetical protein K2173_001285 [Erythroxylum novogranatense]|uniref:YTH domain-containing family protein n=1 Tax=Erythroxylum novogranatense TaxID=1862640 RepID=A0AAV8T4I6_9ROSI|nr:hypothetical protein K2173_001285 [Erythroxylum novogranatense]
MVKNPNVDPAQKPTPSHLVPSKEGSPADCVLPTGDETVSVQEMDVNKEALTTYETLPTAGYYGCYYPGYGGTFGSLDDQGYYVTAEGTDPHYPVMQADNGSLVYFMPGIDPGYSSYSTYLPVGMIGFDGQYFGEQLYSPGQIFQSSIAYPGYLPTPFLYGESSPSPSLRDPSVFVGHGRYGDGTPDSKMNTTNQTQHPPSKDTLTSELSSCLETKSSLQKMDALSSPDTNTQIKPASKSDQPGIGYFPFAKLLSHGQGKGGMFYVNGPAKVNTRNWGSTEKPKARINIPSIRGYGLSNEQNHGDRKTNANVSLTFGGNAAGSLAPDWNGNSNSVTSVITRDQYNLPDLSTKYDHGFFFVIKSYSEDDVHKSIKYNVWASTPNGNKRLDCAYQEAQEKMAVKGSKCPVFLFFSVNASGQFCGVAEMIGRVDFDKNMDFWQQEKWNGYFPVKWHIIKDVPNPHLRHIILENNENKPVTNSRDTQEIRFSQGIEILNIFKNYVSKTSILDDFDFYESRQKVMQEKRLRSLMLHEQGRAAELNAGLQSLVMSAGEDMERSLIKPGKQMNE